MCSEGLSVWFACKLCQSFFLNADDFAYHKKKSHVQQFRSTKFIVFEEQTSPAASPPENWVSFVSPKEEILIHKIISPPTPSTKTIENYNPSKEHIQSDQNEKLIEIEPESEKYFNDPIDGEPDDAAEVSNNSLESVYKDKNTVQSATQYQHNPYIRLKRLKIKNSRNLSSHSSNSTIMHSEFNYTSNKQFDTSDVIPVHKPEVTASTYQNKFNSRSSTINFPPLSTHYEECNSENVNSTAEPNFQEDICRLKRQFANILCVPCLLTFSNSDELNAHNLSFHSTSAVRSPDVYHQTEQSIVTNLSISEHLEDLTSESILPDDVTLKTKFNSVLFKCKFCYKKINSAVFQMHVMACKNHSLNQNRELNISSNKNLNLDPSNLELNFSPKDLLETVKTEYTDEYEDSFPATDVDQDPFEYESRLESSFAEKEIPKTSIGGCSSLVDADVKHRKLPLPTELSRHCVSCKKYFVSFTELKHHNKDHHMAQGGKLRFKCPHLNCEVTARDQYVLGIHLMQVHSNARLFKCPHPGCKKSFKTTKARNGHLKRHTKPVQSGVSKDKEKSSE